MEIRIPFPGRVLLLGCGSVSQCFQPLALRHLEMDFSKFTVMDFEDLRDAIPETLAAGADYVQERVTPENLPALLGRYLGPGDLLIDLAWNIDCGTIVQWCHDNDVLYVNTVTEVWDPYEDAASVPPPERTLYVRHLELREQMRGLGRARPDRGRRARRQPGPGQPLDEGGAARHRGGDARKGCPPRRPAGRRSRRRSPTRTSPVWRCTPAPR